MREDFFESVEAFRLVVNGFEVEDEDISGLTSDQVLEY